MGIQYHTASLNAHSVSTMYTVTKAAVFFAILALCTSLPIHNDVTDTDETDEATDVEIAEDIPEPATCKGGKCCEFYLNGDASTHGTFYRITFRNCKLKLYDNDAGQWLKWNQHVHLDQCSGRTWKTYTAIYDLRNDLTQIRHKSCGA